MLYLHDYPSTNSKTDMKLRREGEKLVLRNVLLWTGRGPTVGRFRCAWPTRCSTVHACLLLRLSEWRSLCLSRSPACANQPGRRTSTRGCRTEAGACAHDSMLQLLHPRCPRSRSFRYVCATPTNAYVPVPASPAVISTFAGRSNAAARSQTPRGVHIPTPGAERVSSARAIPEGGM